jgi:AP-4 complex subunit sigma-1
VIHLTIVIDLILQNELAILEFIHLLVETMDRHFGNVVSLRNPKLSVSQHRKSSSITRANAFLSLSAFLIQCELDIMFHLEKVHFMLEEMVMNGCIVETSKQNILAPIQHMEKSS